MEKSAIEKRAQVFLVLVTVIFLILSGRLVTMQLIQNDKYTTLASENRMRLITIPAPRGEVFDRNGIKLVGNQPVYTVSLISLTDGETAAVIKRLAEILEIDQAEIKQKIEQQRRMYEPVKIAAGVSEDVVTRIEEQRLELPGVAIDIEPIREYPNGNLLAHVMGYVRQINEKQLADNRDKGYKMGDSFGQTGLEYAYEPYLRGQDGGRQVEVDSLARPVRNLGMIQPVPGDNLIMTIDYRVQKAAEEALARSAEEAQRRGRTEAKGGAAVAVDVRTGEVLAMASYPVYDPVKLSGILSQKDYDEIFNSPLKPIINRALLAYAPGSTFKMIVAMAGLEAGKISHQDHTSCPGHFFWGRTYNCHRSAGHGRTDMIRAIKVSCNVYFYQLGLRTGADEIARVAREFGLGEKSGIELMGEESGVVPGPMAKMQQRLLYLSVEARQKALEVDQKYKELLARATDEGQRRELSRKKSNELRSIHWELDWHDYDTIITSVGQGDNRYTPLGLANYVAAIANGGTRYKPYLVQRVVDFNGKPVLENKPVILSRANVSAEAIAVAREGMREVTLPPDGTAAWLFAGLPPVSAKTGTAEVQGRDNHGLFVAFAPHEQPEIAVAVVMEFAGSGSAAAGPVAEAMLAAYFDREVPEHKTVYYGPE